MHDCVAHTGTHQDISKLLEEVVDYNDSTLDQPALSALHICLVLFKRNQLAGLITQALIRPLPAMLQIFLPRFISQEWIFGVSLKSLGVTGTIIFISAMLGFGRAMC
jgi:hypothetical protein